MLKLGIIGLGDIACKAYLPVITARNDVELVFCTRNRQTLEHVSSMYRIQNKAASVDELLLHGIDAAFVHTATESHPEIVEKLLRAGVHVYVDKPIAYTYAESLRLVELAENMTLMLAVGFNRRFAPMVAALKAEDERRLVLMQKNRTYLPGEVRRFVFDDFIHVVDTVRWLAPSEITEMRVKALQKESRLHHLVLHLDGEGFSLMGLMNRDNGKNEETLEVMSPGNKWVVHDLNTTSRFTGGEERLLRFKDWDPVLYRRGFVQIIDSFINDVLRARQAVQGSSHAADAGGSGAASGTSISPRDALETHRICEWIVGELSNK
ncbi:Gfo/Idh/MocA family protein [Paenibacillus gansuensis]|uniref:Gfo/Idh/MocA family protein n=1 Tax=Paenibacillus gansuensis TaxID=306542 RepID=A0ABW5P900_9BACL